MASKAKRLKKADRLQLERLRTLVYVKRNEFNQFVHVPTQFVFEGKPPAVVGVADGRGSTRRLTVDEYDTARNEYRFDVKTDDIDTTRGEIGGAPGSDRLCGDRPCDARLRDKLAPWIEN